MPAPFESDIHKAIASYLAMVDGSHDEPKFVWFHVPNGEVRNKRTAANLKAMGVRPGVWDFVLFAPSPECATAYPYFIEVKRPTETGQRRKPLEVKLSSVQKDFMRDMLSIGIDAEHFAVVDSVDGVKSKLEQWGIL